MIFTFLFKLLEFFSWRDEEQAKRESERRRDLRRELEEADRKRSGN